MFPWGLSIRCSHLTVNYFHQINTLSTTTYWKQLWFEEWWARSIGQGRAVPGSLARVSVHSRGSMTTRHTPRELPGSEKPLKWCSLRTLPGPWFYVLWWSVPREPRAWNSVWPQGSVQWTFVQLLKHHYQGTKMAFKEKQWKLRRVLRYYYQNLFFFKNVTTFIKQVKLWKWSYISKRYKKKSLSNNPFD